MKFLKLSIILFLFVGCVSEYRHVRPLQEFAIRSHLKNDYFQGRTDIHVYAYVIPDPNESPEIRIIIVGKFPISNNAKKKELVQEVESIVFSIRPATSAVKHDSSRITIQIAGYDTKRTVMQYSNHKWFVLDKTNDPINLRKEARDLQRQMASQRGLD